jgi:AcrR family transcriptional regulator
MNDTVQIADTARRYHPGGMDPLHPLQPIEPSDGSIDATASLLQRPVLEAPRRHRRLEGERETEVLHTAFDLFLEHGYHALNLDAMAVRAKVSKATLYRRWPSKFVLIHDAVLRAEELIEPSEVDTGHLRSDLIETFTRPAAALRRRIVRLLAGCPASLNADATTAAELGGRLGRCEVDAAREILARAQARGEIQPDRDLDLAATILPGVLMHYECACGSTADRAVVERMVDTLVLPSTGGPLASQERG